MAGNNKNSHKLAVWLEVAGFVVWSSVTSLFKDFFSSLVSAARDTTPVRGFFAIVTLEGPRLMLISRYRAARMEKGKKVGISAVSAAAVIAIIMAGGIIGSQLIAVSVDGKVIAYVQNEEQYASLLQRAKDKVSEQVGTQNTEILIQNNNVSLEPVLKPQQQADVPVLTIAPEADAAMQDTQPTDQAASTPSATDPVTTADLGAAVTDALASDATAQATDGGAAVDAPSGDVPSGDAQQPADVAGAADPAAADNEDALVDTLISSLMDDSAIRASLYNITVNGQVMATLGTMKDATDVLKMIAEKYAPGTKDYTGKFLDDVAIDGTTTDINNVNVQKPEDAINYLMGGKTEDKTYTAASGDAIENICAALGIGSDELKSDYPDYNFDKINEGDVFNVTTNTPYIRYETVGNEVTGEEIPFDTNEVKTSSLYLGQREIKEEGVNGERMVTNLVTRINGEIDSETEVSSEVTQEPQTETVMVGIQTVLPSGNAYVGPSDGWGGGGNGVLGKPLDSWYFSRGVGNGHYGDDLCAPRGTPIYAAADGTITWAGVFGSYGNLVIIDHGNGLETRYGHCDSFNVTVGQVVQRGQQIATVGTTGHSTAYHLHFEVRVNGVAQEPMDWLR